MISEKVIYSQSPTDWQNKTLQENNKLNNNSKKKTTLIQSPLTTLGQETRWAYSTILLSPHEAEKIYYKYVKYFDVFNWIFCPVGDVCIQM